MFLNLLSLFFVSSLNSLFLPWRAIDLILDHLVQKRLESCAQTPTVQTFLKNALSPWKKFAETSVWNILVPWNFT